ncbi:MAG: hypothetical protein CVT98_04005 [Bacteroidetes bacterium HGW-Bacteroidetes-15]|nr:MAG: hypothetical protein CVT98_04005 [Bacteroidetes bacterium HGW-Bacteroidetes-15]
MDKKQDQLAELREIRNLMERSSRFLSLSGIAGIIVGVIAIAGVAAAYAYLGLGLNEPGYYQLSAAQNVAEVTEAYTFLFANFMAVLILSLITGIYFAVRNAKKQGLPVWDATASRLLLNMMIPLAAGGIYCLILFYHGLMALIAPSTLIFYGLALINASKYAINEIRYLGIIEVAVGLTASLFVDYGLLFWAFGFGLLHIVYGIKIYFKHER